MYELIFVEYGIYSLSVKVSDRFSAFHGGFPAFMVPHPKGNEEFWTKLYDLGNLIEGAYCVCGDFNEVLYLKDRNGRRTSSIQTKKFHEWVAEFALIDSSNKNTRYTWSNIWAQAACSKIDRFFSPIQWQERFRKRPLRPIMPGFGSLHSIIGCGMVGSILFRF